MTGSGVTEVLHLIDTARIGGPGKTILNSARFIDAQRYRVHAASFTPVGPGINEFAAAAEAAGIPFLALPETRRIQFDHIDAVRDYVDAHGISIVHGHGYRSDVVGWLATRRRPVAMVTTHHGWIRNNWKQTLVTGVARQLCRRFDGVEVVASHLLDDLPDSVQSAGAAVVVHNSLVLEDYGPMGLGRWQREQVGVPSDAPLLGVVGRLSIEKGVLEMLDVFSEIAASRPDAHVLFIGDGPLLADLQARIGRSGMGGRVQLVAHQRDVRPWYEALDVLVCPSRTEGLSNVIMEAMAYGLPVVATRVGGNAELVADGETGLLVAPRAPSLLAAGVLRVLALNNRGAEMGAAGRERVANLFCFQTRMRREEAFYDGALSRRRLSFAIG